MIDFILKKGDSINFSGNEYDQLNYTFNKTDKEKISISHDDIQVTGWRFSDDTSDDFYEDENKIVLIYGNIFSRYEKYIGNNGIVKACDLSTHRVNDNFLNDIKGNFCLIIYDKINRVLEVINDQLGIKPVYYSEYKNTFLFSTNLTLLKKYFSSYNDRVFYESIFFPYPITNDTFLNEVKFLPGGSKIELKGNNFNIYSWFNLEEFVFNEFNRKFIDKEFIEIFNDSVIKRYNAAKKKPLVSLTGGFDGRANISVLLKNNLDFKSYSFGKEGGENTLIPLLIKQKINIDYEPIYLEKDYEENYSKFAMDTIFASDGLSIFERANYQYSFSKLTNSSNQVISGLIGGETFGPVHLKTDYINEFYYQKVFEGLQGGFSDYIHKNNLKHFLHNIEDEVFDRLEEITIEKYKLLKRFKKYKYNYLSYFYDLLKLGFPRFYGSEIHTVRFFVNNLTPMFDIDLICYLLTTNHKSIYKKAFQSSYIKRWNNRVLQAKIIKYNFPKLAELPVDRSFKPVDLLRPYKMPITGIKYLMRKRKVNTNTKEFTSEVWSNLFYQDLLKKYIIKGDSVFISKNMIQFIENYSTEKYNKAVNRIISLNSYRNL